MSVESVEQAHRVELFPTYAFREGDDWVVRVSGWVFEDAAAWRWRRRFVRLLERGLRLRPTDERSAILRDRVTPFLVSGLRDRALTIRVGGRTHTLPASNETGHVVGTVRAADDEPALGEQGGWTEVVAETADGVTARCRCRLLAPTGLSVVSDVDDTIKHSNISVRREMLANTFLRRFHAVPGMPALFRDWSAAGAAFHYVSNSPWQMTGSLARFLDDSGFPPGSMHLRPFRVRRGGLKRFISGGEQRKRATLAAVLDDFPRRRFVLVGDTSERDPEIYGDLARSRPQQVERLFLRNVTGEDPDGPRLREAFGGLAKDRYAVFRDPGSIVHGLPDV